MNANKNIDFFVILKYSWPLNIRGKAGSCHYNICCRSQKFYKEQISVTEQLSKVNSCESYMWQIPKEEDKSKLQFKLMKTTFAAAGDRTCDLQIRWKTETENGKQIGRVALYLSSVGPCMVAHIFGQASSGCYFW